MKRLFLLLCCVSLFLTVQAQQLVKEKVIKIGNTFRGFGSSVITREGNVVVTGGYTSPAGYQSFFALLNSNGDTLWTCNGPLISIGGIGIKQGIGPGYFIYTTKRYTSPTASGTILQKYDGNGLLKWTMPYVMNSFDRGHLLLVAPDTGYYLGGESIVKNKSCSFTLGRTDSLGNLKWRKRYDWSNNDFLSDMQHTRNNKIVMYGNTGNPQRLKLLVLDQNGDSVMGRTISIIGASNRHERVAATFCGVSSLTNGGFLMAAEIDTSVTGSPPRLGMVVKADANLQPVWHYIHRALPNNVTFTRSRELTDGSVVVLAYERKGANSAAGNKFFLYRFSPAGSLLNIYTFTSSLATQITAETLEALPDSSFIIGGSGVIAPFPNTSVGFYVAKVKIVGLAPAVPLPVPTLITSTSKELAAAGFTLDQSYPNPATESAIIPFNLPNSYKQANLIIRDITGRQIDNYKIKKHSSSLEVSLSNFSNGLYTYSLLVDEKPVATKKLSVIK